MTNSNQLLALTHFEKNYESFIRYGVELAMDMGRPIKFLYVINIDSFQGVAAGTQGPSLMYIKEIIDKKKEETYEKFRMLTDKINNEYREHTNLSYEIAEGTDITELARVSGKEETGMILTENSVENDVFSREAISLEIIKELNLPVWVIPEGTVYKPFKNIVYATDYQHEDVTSIQQLTVIMRNFNPFIHAVHITENKDFEERVKKEGFIRILREKTDYPNIDIKALSNLDTDKVPELVINYASMVNADLIVLLKENKGFLDKLFKRSISKQFITKTTIPLLYFHEKNPS